MVVEDIMTLYFEKLLMAARGSIVVYMSAINMFAVVSWQVNDSLYSVFFY
jgi:hypothetical protein